MKKKYYISFLGYGKPFCFVAAFGTIHSFIYLTLTSHIYFTTYIEQKKIKNKHTMIVSNDYVMHKLKNKLMPIMHVILVLIV